MNEEFIKAMRLVLELAMDELDRNERIPSVIIASVNAITKVIAFVDAAENSKLGE
jgi:hypothetical protein